MTIIDNDTQETVSGAGYSYRGTRKHRVRTFSILSSVLLPIGIVSLVLGVILLGVGIPAFAITVANIPASPTSAEVVGMVFAYIAFILGIIHFTVGLPATIVGGVFRGVARSSRLEDEANGVDYTGFPYGK